VSWSVSNNILACKTIYEGIVTYSGFFYSRWNLIALQKSTHYSLTQSATLRTHVDVRPARSRNAHSYRNLTHDLLWQSSNTRSHSCSQKASKHTSGQSTIHRRAIGPLSHHNGTSAYSPSLTCHLPAPTNECLHRPPYKLTCSSRPTYKHGCVRPISRPDCSIRISSKTIVTCVLLLRA
jgi:hypothetical protein